jgi:cytochrome c oxidase subunit 3
MFMSPFLPVQSSLWPILVSISLFSSIRRAVVWINLKAPFSSVLAPVLVLAAVSFLWWKDLNRERSLGYHTHKLEVRLRVAFALFILSEVFFFVSFFWAFYDSSLSPTIEIGLSWPPKGVVPLSTYSVPLLNTVILLSSGITITWCHHSIINNLFRKSFVRLLVTVMLGAYFLVMQWLEYNEAQFSISDGVYGSTFFIATGFHGMHVTVGTIFLSYVLIMLLVSKLTWCHHFSFEAAAWYWHFVDVVWLILFLSVYWWGGLCDPSIKYYLWFPIT